MEAAVITAVGIDVSKSKSTVAVRRPGGEIVLRPFEVHHTNSDLKKLASTLKKLGGDIRIVMEHTSTYWRPIALTLKEAGFLVSVVNAMLIHDFSDNTIRKLKTDRADALKIANYALTFWDTLPPFNNEEETRLLLKMQSRANERITATATALRNGLIALADQTFPGVNIAFDPNTKMQTGMKSGWTSFCVIGTRIVSVNIPWRLSRNLIGDGANEKTTSSVQIPLTKSICLHRKAWLLFRNAKVRRC